MSLRTVMYQDGPEYKPETSESPKHIEYGFPAQIVTQIARGWHGDHCAKWSTSTDKGCKPVYYLGIKNPITLMINLLLSCGAAHLEIIA